MLDQLRLKGRFIKKKTLDKRKKAVAAMCLANAAKREHVRHNLTEKSQIFQFEGRRIIDMSYVAEHLICIKCKKDISLRKTIKETQMGLNSILHIMCDECCVITQVRTSKTHITQNNLKHADVNTKAVLGKFYIQNTNYVYK